MKRTLFLWLALGATTTAFTQSPDGITGASAVQTGQTKNKGESIIYKGNTLHTTGKMVKTGSIIKLGRARATKYVNADYIS